ncbi:MAG TPA: hypothetical protein DIT07_10455 [Sphingobacteriaceae bacterium]|nr:hypothetical protein [Sphingobacteriaceae bacterium]
MELADQISYVVPLGTGSRCGDLELLYSLRSLQPSDCWLIGTRPTWYTGNHIKQGETGISTLNIWQKLLTACNTPEISDPFIYGNDDYFYLQPVPIENYYGNLAGNNEYKRIARYTLDILKYNNLPILFFDVHRPMLIYKQLFIDAYNFFGNHLKINSSLLVKSCYGNYAGLDGTLVTDCKLAYWNGEPDIDMFSIGDDCIDVMFKAYCESKWPDKSIYEI